MKLNVIQASGFSKSTSYVNSQILTVPSDCEIQNFAISSQITRDQHPGAQLPWALGDFPGQGDSGSEYVRISSQNASEIEPQSPFESLLIQIKSKLKHSVYSKPAEINKFARVITPAAQAWGRLAGAASGASSRSS
jgi:hypothetical protein